jgi:hypothetical protein
MALLFLLLVSGPAVAQQDDATIDTYSARWIRPLALRHATVRFTSCYWPPPPGEPPGDTIASIYFVRGQRNGVYLVFSEDGAQWQGAALSRRGRVDRGNLMWGATTQNGQLIVIRKLMKSRFHTVRVSDLRKALLTRPRMRCPDY